MPSRSIEQLIQRQIHHWNRYRELLRLADEESAPRPRPIITISRQMGAGARTLADDLARRLDLQVHGYSLIDEIARHRDLERKVVEQLDERERSAIELWVQGVLRQRMFSHDQYHESLARAVRTLAALGGVLFIGRGAHLILGEMCALRVRVVAARESRARRIMVYEGCDHDSARSLCEESDAARDAFLRKLFKVEPDDPAQYDLILNTDRIEPPRLIEVAMAALEARGVLRSWVASQATWRVFKTGGSDTSWQNGGCLGSLDRNPFVFGKYISTGTSVSLGWMYLPMSSDSVMSLRHSAYHGFVLSEKLDGDFSLNTATDSMPPAVYIKASYDSSRYFALNTTTGQWREVVSNTATSIFTPDEAGNLLAWDSNTKKVYSTAKPESTTFTWKSRVFPINDDDPVQVGKYFYLTYQSPCSLRVMSYVDNNSVPIDTMYFPDTSVVSTVKRKIGRVKDVRGKKYQFKIDGVHPDSSGSTWITRARVSQ